MKLNSSKTEKEERMKGKFWKGISGLVIAGLLMATLFQTGCEHGSRAKEAERAVTNERAELLKHNTWLNLEDKIVTEEKLVFISYNVIGSKKGLEKVHVSIFPLTEGSYLRLWDTNRAQFYHIYGKGNQVQEVNWRSDELDIGVEINISEMEYNVDLPKEAVEEIAKRGTEYYLMVRKHFNVDTYEGLKTVIERRKERMREKISKIVK